MRLVYLLVALFALPALASLVGCGEQSETGGAGGVSTATRLFVVREWREDFGYVPGGLEGVKICATDTDGCAWTNDAGRAAVQIPIDREFSFTWEKEGYGPVLVADFEPEGLYLVQKSL